MEDDELLGSIKNNRDIRRRIINELSSETKNLQDLDLVTVINKVMSDDDKTSLTLLKIKSEEKIAENKNNIDSALIAGVLNQIKPRDFMTNTNNVKEPPQPDLPAPELVEGETLIGLEVEMFEDLLPK